MNFQIFKIYSVARKKLMQINDIHHNVKLDDIKTIQSKLSLSKINNFIICINF